MDNKTLVTKFYEQNKTHGKGSNLFFEHNYLYSYGYHFILAKIDTDKNIVFVNNTRYSNSTTRHASYARQFADKTVVETSCPDSNLKIIQDDILQDIKKDYETLYNRRIKVSRKALYETERLLSRCEDVHNLNNAFNLTCPQYFTVLENELKKELLKAKGDN